MTIKPSELEKLSEADLIVVRNAEKYIDAALLAKESSLHSIGCIFCDFPEEMTAGDKRYRELIRRYNEAGWVVEYKSHQRESWLNFTPKRKGWR